MTVGDPDPLVGLPAQALHKDPCCQEVSKVTGTEMEIFLLPSSCNSTMLLGHGSPWALPAIILYTGSSPPQRLSKC